ncbi:hypothetical protein ABZY81_39125 [Streptomyces sp. NPDC006514]|uniref:hypothetical protein n=1 Tax=Streptomyces sp. NPDC006514 TaxID=3154308 RepID=UPI0033BA9B68
MPVREVFRAARTDTGLALALAGADPQSAEAGGIVGRADYLRLLALGASPSLASQILFDGSGQANTWRSEQPAFGAACDAVAAATVRRAERRPSRFTPERRRPFRGYLRAGMATIKAAAEVGITSASRSAGLHDSQTARSAVRKTGCRPQALMASSARGLLALRSGPMGR